MSARNGFVAVITGPTATGKTRLGIELALELGGEVVSADSMQVYRRMDIGTAKPSPEETRCVPHHMLSVAEPWEDFSAARYAATAARCVDGILSRGRLPIIVGGTGLYIDSLLKGREFVGGGKSSDLRHELERRYDEIGGVSMLLELSAVDPERAAKLSPNDKRRIVRALEIYELTGETITARDAADAAREPRYRAKIIALSFARREELYRQIDARVERMVDAGLFPEVSALSESGVCPDSTAMQAIGYKEALLALRGEIKYAEAVELIKRESRRYAKRQLTWLRRRADVKWILWDNKPDFEYARRISTEFLAESD